MVVFCCKVVSSHEVIRAKQANSYYFISLLPLYLFSPEMMWRTLKLFFFGFGYEYRFHIPGKLESWYTNIIYFMLYRWCTYYFADIGAQISISITIYPHHNLLWTKRENEKILLHSFLELVGLLCEMLQNLYANLQNISFALCSLLVWGVY